MFVSIQQVFIALILVQPELWTHTKMSEKPTIEFNTTVESKFLAILLRLPVKFLHTDLCIQWNQYLVK